MKRFFLLAPLLLLSGCASGPSGGPDTGTNSPNRLTITTTFAGTVNNRNYYYFGFDDDDDAGDITGPVAIVSGSNSANGVITGGSRTNTNTENPNAAVGLTVLVRRFPGGSFDVVRRTPRGNGQETFESFPGAFIVPPRVISTTGGTGNTITFTLNLDARNGNGNYLFAHNAQGQLSAERLETNFVTTNQIIRDSQDDRIKPFDALGPNTGANDGIGPSSNVFQIFDIRSTRTGAAAYTEADVFPSSEPRGDVFNPDGSLPDLASRDSLDIIAFRFEVRRDLN